MTENELKPCPFCGGKAYFDRMGTGRQSCIVECGSCGVSHESSDEFDRSGMSWNERHADSAAPSASAQQAEPVYQIWYTDNDGSWWDVTKERRDAHPTDFRRIVYTAITDVRADVLHFSENASVWKIQDPHTGDTWFTEAKLQALHEARAGKAVTGFGNSIAAPASSGSPAMLNPTCSVFDDMLQTLEYTEAVYRLNVVKDSGEPSSTLENLQRVIARAKGASPAALTDEREAFEAWHRSKFETKYSSGQPTRDMHNGKYDEQYGPAQEQDRWETWQARALLAASPADQGEDARDAARWIALAHDSLPPPSTDVFVRGKDSCGATRHDVAGMFNGYWMSQGTQNDCTFEVTHWMSIPTDAAMSASKEGASE